MAATLKPLNPLPNMQSPIVRVTNNQGVEIGKGYLVTPWNRYLQQFAQVAPEAVLITGASPLDYIANTKGHLIISGGTVSGIALTRGNDVFILTDRIVPISIGDKVTVIFSVAPTIKFLGD